VGLLQIMVDSQSNPDNNMVNLYNSRLREFHLDEKISATREQLNQWRNECHKTVDEFYQRKLAELNNYIDEFRSQYEEKKAKIQTKINDQQSIDSIEQDLNDIEQTSLQIHLRSLIIDENYFSIEKEFQISNFKQDLSTSFLYLTESSSAIASNERYLLMHQFPYLSLINQDSKITKLNLWSYGWIRDMCWSKILQCFIVITTNNIYFVNEN